MSRPWPNPVLRGIAKLQRRLAMTASLVTKDGRADDDEVTALRWLEELLGLAGVIPAPSSDETHPPPGPCRHVCGECGGLIYTRVTKPRRWCQPSSCATGKKRDEALRAKKGNRR